MKDKQEDFVNDTGEDIEAGIENDDLLQASGNVVDDDIQYTFVVPKGEIYVDPDEVSADPEPADQVSEEPEPAKTIVADHKRFTDTVNNALQDAAAGLPDDDDITYTFVVPKGEVYREPTPEEEAAAKEAERARRAAAGTLSEETKVIEKKSGKKTRYGLPADHPEMGDLAQKQ